MALGIQRGDEIISMPGRAIGEFPGAGKMKQDAIKVGELSQLRQGFHGVIQDVSAAAKPKRQDGTMTIVKSVLGKLQGQTRNVRWLSRVADARPIL